SRQFMHLGLLADQQPEPDLHANRAGSHDLPVDSQQHQLDALKDTEGADFFTDRASGWAQPLARAARSIARVTKTLVNGRAGGGVRRRSPAVQIVVWLCYTRQT